MKLQTTQRMSWVFVILAIILNACGVDRSTKGDEPPRNGGDASDSAPPSVEEEATLPAPAIYGKEGEGACLPSGVCWANPAPVGFDLTSIHGSSSSDVWAVGERGTIIHSGSHGAAWSLVPSGTRHDLAGIFALTKENAWAVGAHATVVHWNGSAWSDLSAKAMDDMGDALRAVWAGGPNDVWIVGGDVSRYQPNPAPNALPGLVLHYDGRTWARSTSVCSNLSAIGGSSRDDVWVGGQDTTLKKACFSHFDGRNWSPPLHTAGPPSDADVNVHPTAIAVTQDGELWSSLRGLNRSFALNIKKNNEVSFPPYEPQRSRDDGYGIAVDRTSHAWVGGRRIHVVRGWGEVVGHPPARSLFISKADGEVFAAGLEGFAGRIDPSTMQLVGSSGKSWAPFLEGWSVAADESVWVAGEDAVYQMTDAAVFERVFAVTRRFGDDPQERRIAACGSTNVFVADPRGLGHYNGEALTYLPGTWSSSPDSLFCSKEGVLWVALPNAQSLSVFDPTTRQLVSTTCAPGRETIMSSNADAPWAVNRNVVISFSQRSCRTEQAGIMAVGPVRRSDLITGDATRLAFVTTTAEGDHLALRDGPTTPWRIAEFSQNQYVRAIAIGKSGRIVGTYVPTDKDGADDAFELQDDLHVVPLSLGGFSKSHDVRVFAAKGKTWFAGRHGAILMR